MATILRLTRWGVVLMLASKNEVYVTTRNEVMAHMLVWPRIPTFTKIGSCDLDPSWRYVAILKFIGLCVFDIFNHKMQILWPRCLATSVAMAMVLCPVCWGVVIMSAHEYELIGPPGTELRHIFATYIMCPCNLDYWPTVFFPTLGHVTPRLLNVCAYFEVHRHFSSWNIRA